jgi:hypothetical protein
MIIFNAAHFHQYKNASIFDHGRQFDDYAYDAD